MNITITPHLLRGIVTPPPSKSQAHRVLIAAALAQGESELSNLTLSQDISATLSCMEALGAKAQWLDRDRLRITGLGRAQTPPSLFCGESGSTLRFLIPVALALCGGGSFRGAGRLMERPQGPYFEIFQEKGITYQLEGDTLTVSGTLTPGEYHLRGDVSSQFITGLLFALPLLKGDSTLHLTTPLESAGYVSMTLDALRQFGISVTATPWGWIIPGDQTYRPSQVHVEADYSQSAFFYAARGMGNPLTVTGMDPASHQGDRMILPYSLQLNGPGPVELDVRECPDLVPALAVRAALRPGEETRIVGAGRLRIKESDRLASITAVLQALGADIQEAPDSLVIHGKDSLQGGVTLDVWNDHRIAMMAAIAATRCKDPVTVLGAECVQKSYPTFWEDYRALGGIAEETA